MHLGDDIVAQYVELATPTIANALDDVSFAGVMAGLSQIVPGTRCVGRAVTVRQLTGQRGDFKSEDFKVGDMIEAAAPGDVLVIDNAGNSVSAFGGLATLAAKTRGLAGVIVDGGVRDREEMEAHPGVRAAHAPPDGAHPPRHQRHQPAGQLRRSARAAGGYRRGDGSGVVCIPAEHAAQVAALAAKYASDDAAAAAELARGLTFRQAMAKFTRI